MDRIKVTNEEIDEFLKKMAAFRPPLMRDFVTFLKVLKEKEIPLETAVNMIVAMKIREQRIIAANNELRKEWESTALKCDKCGKPMGLAPVNSSPGNQVGGKYKSQWFCPNIVECGHYILSRKGISEIIKKQRRKANYKAKESENGQ